MDAQCSSGLKPSHQVVVGTLLPSLAKDTKLVLRGRMFRVTQIIPEANVVYLEQRGASGKWAGFDLRANLQELQAALAAESAALV